MKHFLKYEESGILLIVFIIIFFVGNYNGFNELVIKQLCGLRSTLYATLAQIMGALLGIVIAGLAILLTMEKSSAMQILKKSPYYEELFNIFILSCKRLALGTLLCVVALVFDRDLDPQLWLSYGVLWCVILSSISMFRCIWVLKNVVKLQIK